MKNLWKISVRKMQITSFFQRIVKQEIDKFNYQLVNFIYSNTSLACFIFIISLFTIRNLSKITLSWLLTIIFCNISYYIVNEYKNNKINNFEQKKYYEITLFILFSILIICWSCTLPLVFFHVNQEILLWIFICITLIFILISPLLIIANGIYLLLFNALILPNLSILLLNYTSIIYALIISGTFTLTLTFCLYKINIATTNIILSLFANAKYLHLQKLINYDALTGIANRRFFDDYLIKECSRANRYQQHIALLMIDVDHFKSYNDRYGHAIGDKILQIIAQKLSNCIHRTTDLVARYGGEEFIVLLPNTSCAGAIIIAEIIRNQIKNLHVKDNGLKFLQKSLTVSIGVAAKINKAELSSTHLISIADKNLYAAKQNGRDCVYWQD